MIYVDIRGHWSLWLLPTSVGRTLQLVPTVSWHYCTTSENPADLLTCGLIMLLQNGPSWLLHHKQWPRCEQSPSLHFCTLVGAVDDFQPASGPTLPSTVITTATNYNTMYKFLAVTGYVFRFVFNCYHNHSSKKGPLSIDVGLVTVREKCIGRKRTT